MLLGAAAAFPSPDGHLTPLELPPFGGLFPEGPLELPPLGDLFPEGLLDPTAPTPPVPVTVLAFTGDWQSEVGAFWGQVPGCAVIDAGEFDRYINAKVHVPFVSFEAPSLRQRWLLQEIKDALAATAVGAPQAQPLVAIVINLETSGEAQTLRDAVQSFTVYEVECCTDHPSPMDLLSINAIENAPRISATHPAQLRRLLTTLRVLLVRK